MPDRPIKPPFTGLSAFPLTPADESGRVDTAALQGLLERIIGSGAGSIGLLGSTGSYMYLTRDERPAARPGNPAAGRGGHRRRRRSGIGLTRTAA